MSQTQDAAVIANLAQQADKLAHENLLAALANKQPAAVLPESIKLANIEHLHPQAWRARGQFNTHNPASLVSYAMANKQGEPALFIDSQNLTARVVLNWELTDQSNGAGQRDFRGDLTLVQTQDYTDLLNATAKQISQREIVELFIDFNEELQPLTGDKTDIDKSAALQALRNITQKDSAKRDSSEGQWASAATVETHTGLENAEHLPAYFRVTLNTHEHLDSFTFYLRVAAHLDDSKPHFTLRIIRPDLLRQAQAQKMIDLLAGIDTAHRYDGQFSAKNP